MGRRTCVSASALSLDAQPAHAARVVSLISRPDCGMGMSLLKKMTSNQFLWLLVIPRSIHYSYGVVVGSGSAEGVVVFGSGNMN